MRECFFRGSGEQPAERSMSGTRPEIRIWYASGAAMILLLLVIGGITRLTGSGLSIVEWKPVSGVLPPLNEAQWQEEFDHYRQFPEYLQRNAGMSLDEFKGIYFWEYVHRMAGRLAALVFFVPFAWFLLKRRLNRKELVRALLLLSLGLGQGVMGWWMVQSGLADRPYVSHYRLGAHLMIAFTLFALCVWFALDRRQPGTGRVLRPGKLRNWLLLLIGLLLVQILWGAFVAGLNAGTIYNTFPAMNREWFPALFWELEPAVRNLVDNPASVQWMHRVLGTLSLLLAFLLWIGARRAGPSARPDLALVLFSFIFIQYVSGVYTLLQHVPVSAAVFHQSLAMVLFGVALFWLDRLSRETPPRAAVRRSKTVQQEV